MNKLLFSGIVTICLVGCSVKADRSDCPCLFNISLEGGMERMARIGVWNPYLLYEDEIGVGADEKGYQCELPRGKMMVSAHSGQHNCIADGSCLRSPQGSQMDEIFAWNANLLTNAEMVSAHGVLHKQYALIHLTLVRSDVAPSTVLTVKGNVNGLNLMDLSPCKGEFNVVVPPVFGKYYRVCVPRQLDSSLSIDIGDTGDSFPLGYYIGNTGYDWSKEDLDDISVEIDYSKAMVTLRILDWNEERFYTYEI